MTRWFLRSARKRVHSRTPSEEPGRSRERDCWDREPSSWPDRMPPSCGRKKRTGFGSHPGERKPKPDAAGTQVVHGDFSPESRGRRATFRRAIEKADRFWSAPWRAKTQARCGWDASSASTFRRHVQLLKPEDTATMQKEMASSASPFR